MGFVPGSAVGPLEASSEAEVLWFGIHSTFSLVLPCPKAIWSPSALDDSMAFGPKTLHV